MENYAYLSKDILIFQFSLVLLHKEQILHISATLTFCEWRIFIVKHSVSYNKVGIIQTL